MHDKPSNVPAQTLKLHDGSDIPVIALGTYLGCPAYGSNELASNEVEQAVSWAIDAGYRHVDTAFRYKVEDQVGRAVATKIAEGLDRKELFITTKLWNDSHARDAVVPALRESLRKLNLDYVDLYLIHWPVGQFANLAYDYTDYLDTWRGMIDAKNLGLAKSIGVSNFNEEQINRILENGLEIPAVLQIEVNLNLQQPSLLSFCRSRRIAVMAYSPLGAAVRGCGAPPPRLDDPLLTDLAHRYNKTVTQIILRYLLELGVIPIPKSVNKHRIEQNLQVFGFALTRQDRELLRGFDTNYRTLPQLKWIDHPYYPFEKSKQV